MWLFYCCCCCHLLPHSPWRIRHYPHICLPPLIRTNRNTKIYTSDIFLTQLISSKTKTPILERFLGDLELPSEEVRTAVVQMCGFVHRSIESISVRFFAELRRFLFHQFPSSFADLFSIYFIQFIPFRLDSIWFCPIRRWHIDEFHPFVFPALWNTDVCTPHRKATWIWFPFTSRCSRVCKMSWRRRVREWK